MRKTFLTDNSARWFDLDASKTFREAVVVHEGAVISRATGNSWEHETLYLTQGGSFIICFSNDHTDLANLSEPQYEEWGEKKAIQWLIANGHFEKVSQMDSPQNPRGYYSKKIEQLEVDRADKSELV